MRITTRAVFQMTDDPTEFIELERDSYEYNGPVSEAKGGGDTTQEVKQDPWGPLQPYIQEMLPGFMEAASQVPGYYPGQTYANFDPLQESSMQGSLDYAYSPRLQGAIRNQFGALDYGLNSVYDPQSNPVINEYLQAAQRPLTQAYEDTVGNAIAGNAAGAGGLGGSRQGVAEAGASGNYMDAMGDLSANVYNNAYNSGLDQQARMMAFAPQTMQAGMYPYDIQNQVGGRFQDQNQRAIDEYFNRYGYNSTAQYNRGTDVFNTLMGQGFGSSSSTQNNPNQSGGLGGAIGGGLLGTSAASALFPAGSWLGAGAAGMGPAGLAGLLGGAALGGLGLF